MEGREAIFSEEVRAEIEGRLRSRMAPLAIGRLISEELIADRRQEALAELAES